MYDELFFHDNAEDCAWFHNGGMELLAEETVQALCELCGVTYKAEVKKEEKIENEKKTVYRVQVGAFEHKPYADALKKELEGKGYKAFVIEG
jgi:cell division protein FtsN